MQRTNEPAKDGYLVNYSSAEQLAGSFGDFTSVQIRETLEFESFTEAMRLLTKFTKRAEPYRELKNYAMVNELGYYKNRTKRPSAQEEYERYLAYLQIKETVHWAKKGIQLTAAQRDDLTRAFYEPFYRAEMAKLSSESSNAYHKDLNDREQSTSDNREVA